MTAEAIDRRQGFTRLMLYGGFYCDVAVSHDTVLGMLKQARAKEFLLFRDAEGDPASFRSEEIVGVRQFGAAQAEQVVASECDNGEGWKA